MYIYALENIFLNVKFMFSKIQKTIFRKRISEYKIYVMKKYFS